MQGEEGDGGGGGGEEEGAEMAGADYPAVAALTPLLRETQHTTWTQRERDAGGSLHGGSCCSSCGYLATSVQNHRRTLWFGAQTIVSLFILSKPICSG